MVQAINDSNEKLKWSRISWMVGLFIIMPPFIGLPFLFFYMWKDKVRCKTDYLVFMLCVAIYLGAINATKIPGGDQMQYHMAYLNVPTQGFIGSLTYIYGYNAVEGNATGISGEFMNGVYNYIGYYLTFGHYSIFAALLTIVDYMLIFFGLYNVFRTMKSPHKPIVCGVITIAFFYLFFQYTLQIQKQFLAQSIMMYVLASYAEKGKMSLKLWAMAMCAVFTHASTGLFLPFLILKPLRGRLTKKWLLFIGFMLFLFILYGPRMAESVASEDSGVAGYGMKRFAESEGQEDLASNLVMSQVLVIAVPMFVIVFRQLWLKRNLMIDKAQAFILNITLLLLLAVASMYTKPLAQIRYFMMLLAFMPFVYPFISSRIKTRNFWLMAIAIVMVVWFYAQFEFIVWDYAPEWQILAYPPLALIAIGF